MIGALEAYAAGLTRDQLFTDRLRLDDDVFFWGTVSDDLNPWVPLLASLLAERDDAG